MKAAQKDLGGHQGTEPELRDRGTGRFSQRILYPPSGAVIAVDPDIPPDSQKIFFIARTEERSLRWVLNGITIGVAARPLPWRPRPGRYSLAISDGNERVVDSVSFEVRGPAQIIKADVEGN